MKNKNDIIGNRTHDLQTTVLCGQSAGCVNVFIALQETTQSANKRLLKGRFNNVDFAHLLEALSQYDVHYDRYKTHVIYLTTSRAERRQNTSKYN
jgi:hypothetical protein